MAEANAVLKVQSLDMNVWVQDDGKGNREVPQKKALETPQPESAKGRIQCMVCIFSLLLCYFPIGIYELISPFSLPCHIT